jgi:hypothetical protein
MRSVAFSDHADDGWTTRRLPIEREVARRPAGLVRDVLDYIARLLGIQLAPLHQNRGERHDRLHLALREHARRRRIEARLEAKRHEPRESLRSPEEDQREHGSGHADEKLKESPTSHGETIHNDDGPGTAPARVLRNGRRGFDRCVALLAPRQPPGEADEPSREQPTSKSSSTNFPRQDYGPQAPCH